MAITLDKVSSAVGSAVNSVQWTHTATGANTYIVVGYAGSNGVSISNIAYNNVSLTKKGQAKPAAEGGELWTKAGHGTGNLTLSAILVGATTDSVVFGACTYNGVSQATPDGTAGITSTFGTVGNLSVGTTNLMTVFAICGDGATATITDPVGQTVRFTVTVDASVIIRGSEKAAVGATTSFSWSTAANADLFMIGIGFSATAAGASTQLLYNCGLTGAGY